MKSPETLSTSAKDNQLKLLVAVQEKPTQTQKFFDLIQLH